jgi:AcrR family transcriptional regulator
VSRPTVYNLYANKAAIYLSCVRRARASLEAALTAAAMRTGDPPERLLLTADAYFRILEHDPRRWELLFGKTGIVGEPPHSPREDLRLRRRLHMERRSRPA